MADSSSPSDFPFLQMKPASRRLSLCLGGERHGELAMEEERAII